MCTNQNAEDSNVIVRNIPVGSHKLPSKRRNSFGAATSSEWSEYFFMVAHGVADESFSAGSQVQVNGCVKQPAVVPPLYSTVYRSVIDPGQGTILLQ